MYKAAFLFDSSNNWLEKYFHAAVPALKEFQDKYLFSFFYEADQVRNFDVVFILGYTKILSDSFLKQNRLNLVVHESDLPAGKGFSPVQWQVLEGKNVIPICLIEAVSKVDSGDIIDRSNFELTGFELWDEIRQKQAEATLLLIKNFLLSFPSYKRMKQEGQESFFVKRRDVDDKLNIDQTIREQFNHIRIADNDKYPLYFEIDGRKFYLKVYKDKTQNER